MRARFGKSGERSAASLAYGTVMAVLAGCSDVAGEAPSDATGASAGAGASAGTPGTGGTGATNAAGAAAGSAGNAGVGAGATGGAPGTSGSGGTGIGEDPAVVCAASQNALNTGRTRLRRLTRSQFEHSVRDLVGAAGSPAASIAPDESVGPFYSNAIAPITDLLVQQHDEAAGAVAADAEPRMTELAGCDLAADTGTTCASSFIESFGLRAYRRPLDTVEHGRYLALYELERAQGTPSSAFRAVVETMLQSPFFLYHTEVGTSDAPLDVPTLLKPHELASRLAFFLWDSMPDSQLFARAADGTLADPATLAGEVERLLLDPKAGDSVRQFHVAWLGVRALEGAQKDTSRFPSWSPALASALANETATFADFVVRQGDGSFATLLTGGFSFLEGPLLALYGVSEPAGYVPGTQVTLNPAERAGLLTMGAFLATHAHRDQTSPVHRGILVRENLLCQPLDPPPADVNNVAPPVSDITSTRERFLAHTADPSCAGCHTLIDPIGLGFENYDAIGAFRSVDAGSPVDASGEVLEAGADVAGPFNGAVELSRKLAASQQAADCVANQWFRYALGRMEASDDACSVAAIREAFNGSGNNVRTLIGAIVASDAFRHVRSNGTAQ
jgi:hypothetical protein